MILQIQIVLLQQHKFLSLHFNCTQGQIMISTTYIHKRLQYFFTRSEEIDLQIGNALNLSINYCLDGLQQTTLLSQNNNNSNKYKIMQCAMALLSHLVNTSVTHSTLSQSQTILKQQFTINYKNYIHFYQSDGFRCCIFALKNYLQYLSNATNTGIKITIIDQMIIKTFINLIYVIIFGYAHANKVCNNRQELTNLKQQLLELEIDNLIIKMVTLTLQVYYLPIKKLVMLYMRVLTILFYNPNDQSSNKLNPQIIYQDQQMLTASVNNLLSQTYLQQFKQKNKPQNIKEKAKTSSVQNYYSKHNVGDCPLAQSIVVGLLRSLLTICNSQIHKKFQQAPSKGTGADSYRQWQISYQFLCQQTTPQKDYKKYLSNRTTKFLKDYIQYNQLSQSNDKQLSSTALNYPTHYQFYRHKIYTTSAISTFFTFLLIHFKRNTMIQFTYLYQLISDANGILVFLKFLTDKFQYLQPISEESQKSQNVNAELSDAYSIFSAFNSIRSLQQLCRKNTQFLILIQLLCKILLIKLIIKKIPHIFMKVHKNDDQLPSQQQIQAQFGQNYNKKRSISQTSTFQSQMKNKVKQLTQLCYSLLKIQIPFFSKKMKQNSNNMKMIVDIYCQMPKKVQPIKRTQLDKLILKNKMKKDQHQKFVLSVQQLKGIHNQYNNMYYWANQQAKINENNQKKQQIVQVPLQMTRQNMNKWLQENVWKFYD